MGILVMRLRWCAVVLMFLLSGCAVENRLLMPKSPLNGQSESQVLADKRECGDIARSAGQQIRQAHQAMNRNLAIAGLVTGVFLNSDEGPAAENEAYKTCMTERGYR